jgi:hypothetical protein
MTRLNLPQTCLLDVSGELGKKAKAQLHEHVAKYPAAMIEYELVRSQFQLLRSVPRLPLDELAARRMAAAIKQGVHRELNRREHQVIMHRRWRLAYRALAGITSVAAALVIYFGVKMVQTEATRREIAQAESHVQDYLSTDTTNQTDSDLDHVATQIAALEDAHLSLASQDDGTQSVQDLINSADDVPDVPDAPGSF